LPIQPADDSDLFTALEVVRAHRLAFWDAMLWASAERAGVRHMLTEDFQDGFVLGNVTFINPFIRENDELIEKLLPPP
jgi:predicted nucleic acid-binding protein